jgi:hypothetical protein
VRRLCIALPLLFLTMAGDGFAQDEVIYKCTDANGAVHYTADAIPGCVVASVNKRAPKPQSAAAQSLYGSQAHRAPSGTSYANCSEARAAGAAPVRRGDPGYSRKLDRDGDGIGCE